MSDFQRVKEDSQGNLTTGDDDNAIVVSDEELKESRNISASVAAEVSAKVADNRERIRKGKKAKKEDQDLKQEIEMDEHLIPLEELFARYNTSLESGMSSSVAEREAELHPNKLTPPKETPEIVKFLKILFGGFAMLLWVGGILCFIAYGIETATNDDVKNDNLYLGIVLVAVVLITGIFSYFQEAKSDKVMKGFLKMQPQSSRVLRDGKWQGIDATLLVCGDIVDITFGNVVPADVRIIQSNGFKIDNSSITGEPDALLRSNECTDDNPMETKNIAFYSTNAVEGTATAIVVRTGDRTFMGIIASLVANTKKKDTPLNREIAHFIHLITVIAIILGVTFFILAIAVQGYYWLDAVIFLIGIIVANVPEGLLATVTVSLTLTARRLAEKNVLVKNLEAVETLGSTSCICSDKTGTLTQNRMTVNHLWYDNKIWAVDRAVEGCFKEEDPSFKVMYNIACLNSRAEFDEDNPGDKPIQDWATIGDASESALIKFCEQVRPIDEARNACNKAAEIPFNSTNKYAVSICESEDPNDERYILYMKGAPERVLDRCNKMLVKGEEITIDDTISRDYDSAYTTLGGQGERVLGFAYMILDGKQFPRGYEFDIDNINFPLEGLVFAGLYALIDPPRPAVPSSVKECQSAGIRVIMVTGDHPITARAIARQVNIIHDDTVEEMAEKQGIPVEEVNKDDVKAIVINGTMLKDMEDDKLKDILRHYQQIVFARTSPQQKLVIVEAVQDVGNVVAVTGDGVNDSPALRQADIGVAMGIAGTDVSKSAADMILLDDDFSSIVKGVEEGRLIFDNLKKSIAYTLTSNIPEITPFLFFIMLNIPLPLSTIMILCIDLGTDMYPAISLAYEQPESDIMRRKPRDAKKDKLVTAKLLQMTYLQIGVIQAMAGFFNYFVVFGDHGFRPEDLFGIREAYDDKDNQAVLDSYGQQWDFESRVELLQMSNTAFLLAIIEVQWADLIICKTRMLSVIHQGMRNANLNFSLCFETVLAIFIIYVPGMDVAFTTRPLRFVYWLPAIPFSCLILLFDETRKFFIRLYPGGWVYKEFYY